MAHPICCKQLEVKTELYRPFYNVFLIIEIWICVLDNIFVYRKPLCHQSVCKLYRTLIFQNEHQSLLFGYRVTNMFNGYK